MKIKLYIMYLCINATSGHLSIYTQTSQTSVSNTNNSPVKSWTWDPHGLDCSLKLFSQTQNAHTHAHNTRPYLLMVRCCGTKISAEAASTALTAKGYVRELRVLELPQLLPLWAPKANNKLLVIPYVL